MNDVPTPRTDALFAEILADVRQRFPELTINKIMASDFGRMMTHARDFERELVQAERSASRRVRCQQCQRVYSKPDNPDCPECGNAACDDMPNARPHAEERSNSVQADVGHSESGAE